MLQKKYMVYGSERFKSATNNNHNEIFLTDTCRVIKIVLGKYVVAISHTGEYSVGDLID